MHPALLKLACCCGGCPHCAVTPATLTVGFSGVQINHCIGRRGFAYSFWEYDPSFQLDGSYDLYQQTDDFSPDSCTWRSPDIPVLVYHRSGVNSNGGNATNCDGSREILDTHTTLLRVTVARSYDRWSVEADMLSQDWLSKGCLFGQCQQSGGGFGGGSSSTPGAANVDAVGRECCEPFSLANGYTGYNQCSLRAIYPWIIYGINGTATITPHCG